MLFQQAFWVGDDRRPDARASRQLPDHLLLLGLADDRRHRLVILVIAQLVFSRLERQIPERI